MESVEMVLVLEDSEAAEEIRGALPEGEAHVGEQRALDGGAAEWVVFATMAAPVVKTVLDMLLRYVERDRVKSLKYGELEIENPSKEDVQRILDRALSSKASDEPAG